MVRDFLSLIQIPPPRFPSQACCSHLALGTNEERKEHSGRINKQLGTVQERKLGVGWQGKKRDLLFILCFFVSFESCSEKIHYLFDQLINEYINDLLLNRLF
jgi:hypothetical protein